MLFIDFVCLSLLDKVALLLSEMTGLPLPAALSLIIITFGVELVVLAFLIRARFIFGFGMVAVW